MKTTIIAAVITAAVIIAAYIIYEYFGSGIARERSTGIQVKINNDEKTADTMDVTVQFILPDNEKGMPRFYYLSEDNNTPDDKQWRLVSRKYLSDEGKKIVVPFKLSEGNGEKSVYAWYRTEDGRIFGGVRGSIILEVMIIDEIPPQIRSVSVVPITTDPTVSLSIDAEDNEGIGYYSITGKKDAEDKELDWRETQTGKITASYMVGDKDGSKRLYVRVKDAAGNLSMPFQVSTFLDTAPPEGRIYTSVIKRNEVREGYADIRFTARDNLGVDSYYLSSDEIPPLQDSGKWKVVRKKRKSIDLTEKIRSGDINADSFTIHAWFKDKAGNVSKAAVHNISIIEPPPKKPTKPRIILFDINNGVKVTQAREVDITFSVKNGSEIVSYILSEDEDRESNNWVQAGEKVKGIYSARFELTPGNGSKSLYLSVKDRAGGVSDASTVQIALDTEPPDAVKVVLNQGEEETDSSIVGVKLEASDNIGIREYYISEDSEVDLEDVSWRFTDKVSRDLALFIRYQFNKGNGEKVLYAYFRDEAGNISVPAFDEITVNARCQSEIKDIKSLLKDNPKERYNAANYIKLAKLYEDCPVDDQWVHVIDAYQRVEELLPYYPPDIRVNEQVKVYLNIVGAGMHSAGFGRYVDIRMSSRYMRKFWDYHTKHAEEIEEGLVEWANKLQESLDVIN